MDYQPLINSVDTIEGNLLAQTVNSKIVGDKTKRKQNIQAYQALNMVVTVWIIFCMDLGQGEDGSKKEEQRFHFEHSLCGFANKFDQL